MSDIATKIEKLQRPDQIKLVYEWMKTGNMTLSQFRVLLYRMFPEKKGE